MSDEIDDRALRHEFLCVMADEWRVDEVLVRTFPVAERIFTGLLIDNVSWADETFIKNFQAQYENLHLSALERINLLMFESVKVAGDEGVYTIYSEAIKSELFTSSSRISLLEKVIFYSYTHTHALQIYYQLKKETFLLQDIISLARCWRDLCIKYNVVDEKEMNMLINHARSAIKTEVENLSFSLFLAELVHRCEATKRLKKILDVLVKKIRDGGMEYHEVQILTGKLSEQYTYHNDTVSAMIRMIYNRLFGVFYENQNR